MNTLRTYFWIALLLIPTLAVTSCDDDAPEAENEEEVITTAILTFTPVGGGDAKMFTYLDPDGDGSQAPVTAAMPLEPNTEYVLTIELAGPNGESITEEVRTEADEHMIFFGWTEGYFTTPTGNGNIDAREEGTVDYNDEDNAELPLGLSTTWTTGDASTESGTFQIMLKHQPDIKSETSTSQQGSTDFVAEWDLMIQ